MIDKKREAYLKRKYGITIAQYEAMYAAQGGKCALCGRPPKKKRLAVDHNHKTSVVRGLLCRYCNYNLWWWDGNREAANRIADYLKGR